MCALRGGIVGGAGQVGLALARGLASDNRITPVAICRNRMSAARAAANHLDVRIARTDSPEELRRVTEDLDVLINCALPQYTPGRTAQANRLLAGSLTTACAGRPLVHLSSVAVYGDFIPGCASCFLHPRPDTAYGRQKLHMERLLRINAGKNRAVLQILRVGHVYGSELRWSAAICESVRNPGFRLPFDGAVPSNAIAIQNLVAAIRMLILAPTPASTLNVTDHPQTTWRELFDLHSEAAGAPVAGSLGQAESASTHRRLSQRSRAGMMRRITTETAAWARSLPASYVAAVPSLKLVVQSALARVGSARLDSRLWAVKCRHLSATDDQGADISPLYFSDAVPGPSLEYPPVSRSVVHEDLELWLHCSRAQWSMSMRTA